MRAVVKHSYVKGRKALAKAKAHVNYLQHRPGQDREQGPRQFFDGDREHITGREVKRSMAEYEERGMVIHKLILSPGCEGVDLQSYTRETLEEYGRQKGLDLEWKAIAHTNTDHDHIHVVVMGTDKNGRLVRFDREDYKKLRELQDRYIEREHKLERYLDREMADLLREGNTYKREGDREFQKLIGGRDPDEDERNKRPFKDLTIERQFDLLDKTKNWHAAFGGSHSHEISRRLSRKEVIRRQQGRMQEYHADYQRQMAEKYWKDMVEKDPSQAAAAQKQLEYIKEFKQEQVRDSGWRDLDSLLGERHSRTDREERQKIETRMQVREHIQMHQHNERSDDEKSRDDEGRGE